MSEPITIKKLNLEELLKFIEDKQVAIPEFQRDFVWNQKKVRNLFDSLVKKYPIGSFIIWKTNQQIGSRNLFVKEPTKFNQKYLVLDGQQRLLSIYYLCKQKEFEKVSRLFEEICTCKEKNIIDFKYFYFDAKKRKKPELFYNTDKSNEFNLKDFKKAIGTNYLFPVIIVSIDDYQKAIEVFERINQAGTRISTEAIFLSEAWNKKTNLGQVLRKWKSKNKDTVSGKLENIIFIHALAIIIQLEKLRDENNEYNPKNVDISLRQLKKIAGKIKEEKSKVYEKELNKVLEAITEAMSFLKREFKIKRISDLPSQTMVSILSVFFYYCEPSKKQKKELRKWFWRASLGSRYIGSGYTENGSKDPIKMKELAKMGIPLNIEMEEMSFYDLKNTDMHAGRSTIRNSIKLMLWDKEPLWINGVEINPEESESKKRKKEDDHFYPYDFYRKGIVSNENEINSILNLCYLTKSENDSKSNALPSDWLEERENKIKSKAADEKKFFLSSLLPFDSIRDLKDKESGLSTRKGSIKPKVFRKYYKKFLQKRFKEFEKELKRLQKGA